MTNAPQPTTQQLLILLASDPQIVKMGMREATRLVQRELVIAALERNNGDREKAAQQLKTCSATIANHLPEIKLDKKRVQSEILGRINKARA